MNNRPKVDKLKADIQKMRDFIKGQEITGNTNPLKIEIAMEKHLSHIYKSYPFIAKMLCKKQDETPLKRMLYELEQVEKGKKDFKETEKKLGEELANKFIYPKIKK